MVFCVLQVLEGFEKALYEAGLIASRSIQGTLPYLILTGGWGVFKLHNLKKNPSSSFNYYKRVT